MEGFLDDVGMCDGIGGPAGVSFCFCCLQNEPLLKSSHWPRSEVKFERRAP